MLVSREERTRTNPQDAFGITRGHEDLVSRSMQRLSRGFLELKVESMTGTELHRPRRESAFWRFYDRERYAILFYALLLTLLLLPAAAALGLPTIMIKLLVGASLLAAVLPNASRKMRLIVGASVLLVIAARAASESGYLPISPALILILVGVLGLAAAAGTLRFTIASASVTAEAVYAALSTYLLAGLFFGQIYWSIEQMSPGSLVGPDPVSEVTSVYYSFVTLATLGYGDFLPRSDITRGIATFEVIGGQLYLAVLVARLIGAFGGSRGDAASAKKR